jgi:hypothetical protein
VIPGEDRRLRVLFIMPRSLVPLVNTSTMDFFARVILTSMEQRSAARTAATLILSTNNRLSVYMNSPTTDLSVWYVVPAGLGSLLDQEVMDNVADFFASYVRGERDAAAGA